jgi:quinolinate synthase
VLVHPECRYEVVNKSDLNGSTEFIIKTIREAPGGSKWAVGTEMNLVNRLAKQHPDKFITLLAPDLCMCATMFRIAARECTLVTGKSGRGPSRQSDQSR